MKSIGKTLFVIGLLFAVFAGYKYITKAKVVDIGLGRDQSGQNTPPELVTIPRIRYDGGRWSIGAPKWQTVCELKLNNI